MRDDIIVLDTHTWLWYAIGDETLNSSACELIDEAVITQNVGISIISIWELGMLESKGRISFPDDVLIWTKKALMETGIKFFPISPEIAINSSRLPGNFHGDPADRIIVATTHELNAILITRDRKIIKYCKENGNNYCNVFKA
ncbi:PIN domain-containing protein [Candidatus Magnetomoraceae bacterium gMMP-15]